MLYSSGRQPVGSGPNVGLSEKCIGPHNTFCNKVNMGRVCHFFSRLSIILTLSVPRLRSLKILVQPKNFVKNYLKATILLSGGYWVRQIRQLPQAPPRK